MKLDRVFHSNLSLEVKNSKKEYRKKYTAPLVVGTLIWWAVLLWLLTSVDFFLPIVEEEPMIGFLAFALPIILYVIGYQNISERAEDKMFENIAKYNGGTFEKSASVKGEKAAIFRPGHTRRITNIVRSKSGDNPFRFFRYQFSKGYGKYETVYHYHILAIGGTGIVPHMYLNHHNSGYSLSLGKKLSLPSEFEKEFTLSIPESYHLEALQVFTPDVLASILDLPIKCDIEFAEGEMLLLFEGIDNIFTDFAELERLIKGGENIIALLKPKLENLRWAPVGDKTFSL